MVKVHVGGSVINRATPSSLSSWPEHMPMLIKHNISGTLGSYLSIIVEPFLKMDKDRILVSVVSILTPLKLCFIQNFDLLNIYIC